MDQIGRMPAGSVVHVISDAGPHPYFRTLVEAGRIDRSTVAVGCVGPAGPLQDEMRALGVATFALGAPTRRASPVAIGRLIRLLRRARPAVVQGHLVDGCLVGLTAARAARVPVTVMTAHHSHELPFHGRKLTIPDRLCAGPLSDVIIAPSRDVADTLVRLAGASPDRIAVVHHGFDLERLDPARLDPAPVRAELGIPAGTPVFGAIGRLTPIKNHPALIQAFAAATAAALPDARLLIAGAGDPAPLHAAARAHGVAGRVTLTGPRPDIPQLLAACDVFVHPAVAESFGMVIVEAMATGTPVVSTPVGIAPEVLAEPGAGLLTAGPSASALRASLARMVSLRSHWARMGAQARRRAAPFTAERMAAGYAAVYARVRSGVPAP